MDDLLTAETGESLGRLLIDYQKLESAIRSSLGVAFAAIDPLGIVTNLWTSGMTTQRKIQVANSILSHAAKLYRVPETRFTGEYPVMIDPRDSAHAHRQVLKAFAGMRDALSNATDLLSYRNNLFHGDVKVEGSEIQFVDSKMKSVRAEAAGFQRKRQQVMSAMVQLLMAAGSVRVALEYLTKGSMTSSLKKKRK